MGARRCGRGRPCYRRLWRERGTRRRLPLGRGLRRSIGLWLRWAVARLWRIGLRRLCVGLSRRRRVSGRRLRRVGLWRRRAVTRRGRCGCSRASGEIRSNRGAEGIHALRRTEARAVLHRREAAGGSWCEASLSRWRGRPSAGRRRGRAISAARLRRGLPSLLRRGRVLLRGRGLRSRSSPSGRRRGGRSGWLRGRAIAGRCRGSQGVAAR
jgi:hypothetical protein